MTDSNISKRMIVGAVILLISAPAASADIILSFEPSSQPVALGSQAIIDLNISGLGDPPSLGTFDLNVNFDPTILSFNAFSFGDPVLGDQLDPTGGGNTISFTNPGFGTVELFDLSLDSDGTLNSLQAPSFTLGVLTFDTIGAGASSLNLSINALGDADGNSLSATLEDGSVSVSAVPEPSSLVLISSILVLCAGMERLRRRRC